MKRNTFRLTSLLGGLLVMGAGITLGLFPGSVSSAPEGQGSVTVTKVVINDNGGVARASDWTLSVTPSEGEGRTVSSGEVNSFFPGTYTIGESGGPRGYTQTSISCTNGEVTTGATFSLGEGDSYTCTITNDDIAPSLTLNKEVINDDGGIATASDWTLTATRLDGPVAFSGTSGVASGAEFQAGKYVLSETPVNPESEISEKYTASNWSCSVNEGEPFGFDALSLGIGDVANCTITNNDKPATLTIIKKTDEESGDGYFNFAIVGTGDTQFEDSAGLSTEEGSATSRPIELRAGSYDVTENSGEGWHLADVYCVYDNESVGESIPQGGEHITVAAGDEVTCTFTNTRQGTLIIKKVVVNDNGGTKKAGDFTYSVGDDPLISFRQNRQNPLLGQNYKIVNPEALYGVTEYESTGEEGRFQAVGGYNVTYDNCSNLQIPAGEEKVCTITNDDIAPPQPPAPPSGGGSNGAIVNSGGIAPFTLPAGSVLGASSGPGGENDGSGGSNNNPLTAPSINQPTSGQVLGAETDVLCGLPNEFATVFGKNDPEFIKKIQAYFGLPQTGLYGPLTIAAVKAFQLKYLEEILTPWGLNTPTGNVYITTLRKMRLLKCPEIRIPLPTNLIPITH